jgi:hypothetical protein
VGTSPCDSSASMPIQGVHPGQWECGLRCPAQDRVQECMLASHSGAHRCPDSARHGFRGERLCVRRERSKGRGRRLDVGTSGICRVRRAECAGRHVQDSRRPGRGPPLHRHLDQSDQRATRCPGTGESQGGSLRLRRWRSAASVRVGSAKYRHSTCCRSRMCSCDSRTTAGV